MTEKPNFRPRVIEPLLADGNSGFGVELEFHEDIPGLGGDTVVIRLRKGTSISEAEDLVERLGNLGVKVSISNPH